MTEQGKPDNHQPERRKLLKTLGALGGALVVGGGLQLLVPQHASMMLVAFDVLAGDKAELERLSRLLTICFAWFYR